MIDRFLAFVIFGAALVFAVTAIKGLRSGYASFPLKLIQFEEFERTESTANFWGITILNIAVAASLLFLLVYWFVNGMIK